MKDKKDFKKNESKDPSPSQAVTCYECRGHGHVKKECPTYLKAKGKVFATTLRDLDSSNSNLEESCYRGRKLLHLYDYCTRILLKIFVHSSGKAR